jgi:hypothetical protein
MQEGEEEDDAFPRSHTQSGIGLVGWSLGRMDGLRLGKFFSPIFLPLGFLF